MIEIVEHGLTDGIFKMGAGHEEFLSTVRKLTLGNEISTHDKVFLSVLYDPNIAKSIFHVWGYDSSKFSPKK